MTILTKEMAKGVLRNLCNNPNADFREGQWEAIESVIHRKRLLLVRRTGWGKSAVYFIATKLLRETGSGPTLLVSPLLALMRNQIEAAVRTGIRAYTINSTNKKEWDDVRQCLEKNQVDILLISPERLANEEFIQKNLLPMVSSIGLFVIDEAHCISDWGHDFRPDYRRIIRILRLLPDNIPVLSTTATANNRVVQDIQEQLGTGLEVNRGSLIRPSLKLQNIQLLDPVARMAWLADYLPKIPGTGIVYTLTVRDTVRLADWLRHRGINAVAYNSEVSSEQREKIEQDLLVNKIKVVIGTTALGMGFDKPDLGFVIHYQRPGSVVHYYQQVGRAGRAVDTAYGILFCGKEDDDIIEYFIEQAFPPQCYVDSILQALSQHNGLTIDELQAKVDVPKKRIEHALKYLLTEEFAPVIKQDIHYFRTPIPYQLDDRKIDRITQIRRAEQKVMQDYMQTSDCLMQFLSKQLDDPNPAVCYNCSNCRKAAHFNKEYSSDTAKAALEFLKRCDVEVEPRKRWPVNAFEGYDFSGNISNKLMSQEGRCLCIWGDPVLGQLVKQGKQQTGQFHDDLIDASVDIIKRWKPYPFPEWVTCIPSHRHTSLVSDFAQKLAKKLNLDFSECICKIKDNLPQKQMQNSYHQARNLDGAFDIIKEKVYNGPVLLVDDMVDSRWTFTVTAALLRQNGSGPVWPFALAMTSHSGD